MSAFFKSSGSPGAGLPWESPPSTPQRPSELSPTEVKEPRIIPLKVCQVSRKQCPPDTENRYYMFQVKIFSWCCPPHPHLFSPTLSFVFDNSNLPFLPSHVLFSLLFSYQVSRGDFFQQKELRVPASERPSHGSGLVQCHTGLCCQPFATSEGGDEDHATWHGG